MQKKCIVFKTPKNTYYCVKFKRMSQTSYNPFSGELSGKNFPVNANFALRFFHSA